MKRLRHSSARILAGSLLCGVLLGAGTISASAGIATGGTSAFTVGGNSYRDFARVSTKPGQAQASTWIARTDGTASSGWLGANARLFRSNGAMIAETGFRYNGSAYGSGTYFAVPGSYYGVYGTFYSYGVVKGWNGSSYGTYYTFVSPNQTS